MFNKFKKELKEVEKEVREPVAKEVIENIVKLITVAHETNSQFNLTLILPIGEFTLDSDAYTNIKILDKSKKEEDRLVVSYQDALLSSDTIIELSNIVGYTLNIHYSDEDEGLY